MTNNEIAAREGEEFKIIDGNYSERQIQASIASKLEKVRKAIEQGGGGGGGSFKTLSADDYDYPADNPTCIAGWALEPGYYVIDGTDVEIARYELDSPVPTFDTGDIFVKVSAATDDPGIDIPKFLYTRQDENELAWYVGIAGGEKVMNAYDITHDLIAQTTGQSTTKTMSQKAITDSLAGATKFYFDAGELDPYSSGTVSDVHIYKDRELQNAANAEEIRAALYGGRSAMFITIYDPDGMGEITEYCHSYIAGVIPEQSQLEMGYGMGVTCWNAGAGNSAKTFKFTADDPTQTTYIFVFSA